MARRRQPQRQELPVGEIYERDNVMRLEQRIMQILDRKMEQMFEKLTQRMIALLENQQSENLGQKGDRDDEDLDNDSSEDEEDLDDYSSEDEDDGEIPLVPCKQQRSSIEEELEDSKVVYVLIGKETRNEKMVLDTVAHIAMKFNDVFLDKLPDGLPPLHDLPKRRVKESLTLYAVLVLSTPKKDGSWRMCLIRGRILSTLGRMMWTSKHWQTSISY